MTIDEVQITEWQLHFTLKKLPSCVVWDGGIKINIEGIHYPVISSEKRDYVNFSNASAKVSKDVFDRVIKECTNCYTFRTFNTLCGFINF